MRHEKKTQPLLSPSLGSSEEQAIKELVKEKYSSIATQTKTQNATSCCGATSSCDGNEVYNIIADDYIQL